MARKEKSVRHTLEELPWFRDLTPAHQREMEDEIQDLLSTKASRDEYSRRLKIWGQTAHEDMKRERLGLLRSSGLLQVRQSPEDR